jgi:ElaB/YqjD/DUF883 family membrane-anchored ribosome-binding protein
MSDEKKSEKVRAQVDDVLAELTRMADEIRLKVHLGSMEAKDEWNDVEPKLKQFEKKAEEVVERTGDELKDLGADLKARFKKLKEDLGA